MLSENVLKGVHSLIEHLREHPVGSVARSVLTVSMPDGLDELALNEINRERREASAPLVFAFHPGYVWVGPQSAPRCFLDPGYVGLINFWQILLSWQLSHYVPPAQDLVGAPTGNALKGRLSTAADWLEGPADCRRLGSVLRGTEVGRGGCIILPPGIPELQLFV